MVILEIKNNNKSIFYLIFLLTNIKATFSAAPVTVTQECATTCSTSPTVACTQVANKNQVLGCYVGTYYTTSGTSTFARTICPLVSSGISAAFCKVRNE
jgi:hypothetical protein